MKCTFDVAVTRSSVFIFESSHLTIEFCTEIQLFIFRRSELIHVLFFLSLIRLMTIHTSIYWNNQFRSIVSMAIANRNSTNWKSVRCKIVYILQRYARCIWFIQENDNRIECVRICFLATWKCQTKLSHNLLSCSTKRSEQNKRMNDIRDYRILKLVIIDYPFSEKKYFMPHRFSPI